MSTVVLGNRIPKGEQDSLYDIELRLTMFKKLNKMHLMRLWYGSDHPTDIKKLIYLLEFAVFEMFVFFKAS